MAVVIASGCKQASEPSSRGAPARVTLEPGSTWKLERAGSAPVLRSADHWIYAYSERASEDQHQLPGVSAGDARGPRLGLLSGQFAPLVLFDDSRRDWPLSITSSSATLHIRSGDTSVDVHGEEMTLRGAPFIALPADRTAVQGMLAKTPSFALNITAGEKPGIQAPHADRVRITAAKLGTVEVGSETCTRPLLVSLVPRGSTSVFLLRFGPIPEREKADPLFFAEPSDERAKDACPKSVTSTLSVRLTEP